MAKGSQLAQLKTALSSAGLSRQSQSKKRKRVSTKDEVDKVKRAKKLQEIRDKLNPFELKVTKLKHDVGGRKLKGVVGKPQQSKQTGIEQRKKTLLKEYKMKDHAGGIIDRRFGENDPTMTPEERMLERFTRERQRASRGTTFNLEDEDELTHYGQSLSKLDDFDNAGMGLDDDDEEDGKIDSETVKHAHFGGFQDEEQEGDEDEPERKKSKAEVMAEVIAKSKMHKAQRQLERQQDDETRHQLDQELNDIRGLLFAKPAEGPEVSLEKADKDVDYDQQVRELALDKRAQPKDRTKTEEELALEAKEALEKAERKRLKRMMGEEDDSSDEEGGKRKRARMVGGDDLEDDFVEEGEAWEGLGAGLEGGDVLGESDEEHEGSGDDDNNSEEDEEEDEDFEGFSGGEDGSASGESDSDAEDLSHKRAKKPSKQGAGTELPYTFPCPETHDDLLNIVEDVRDEDVPVVIQRIRTLYHPSLAEANKYKLQAFTGVLVDYILYVMSPPSPRYNVLQSVIPHLHGLTTSYPIESASHFNSKLKLMQKNLVRGLSRGATSPDSRTWPGLPELALLLTISHVWPTSDMNHAVVTPARLLMGSYLGLCRVRSLKDLASGLFLCTIFLRFESFSKRFVPEVPVFLFNCLLHLLPHKYSDADSVPGSFPCPDLNSELCRSLRITKKAAKGVSPGKPNVIDLLLDEKASNAQEKIDLLALALELLRQTSDMYKSLEGFIEVFEPAIDILKSVSMDWAADELKTKINTLSDSLQRLLKFAKQARKPLALQAHKPIPIATYIPKFESHSSTYLRKQDPDFERAQASKLRYQYKQERKGAIRELRKDARFLSAVQHQEQMEKDAAYAKRMKQVFGSLESERAEQKKMEKEKAKEKKRSGRK